ncbi:hypothetical protein C9J85_05110 [Haloferax sp. wsp5]|nr:hypothetical protein C9J85_05110 [Haloferax sp. wsp5]
MTASGPQPLYDGCTAAIQEGRLIAEPGYTIVSEIGYMLILVYSSRVATVLPPERRSPQLYFATRRACCLADELRAAYEDEIRRAVDAAGSPIVEYRAFAHQQSRDFGTVCLLTLLVLVVAWTSNAWGATLRPDDRRLAAGLSP